MILNQWVPAAHRGDAIGDSARRLRALLRGMGHRSDLYALTIDDDLHGDVQPFEDPESRRGDLTILHFGRPHPPLSQRDARRVLRAVRPGTLPSGVACARGAGHAGWPRRPGARRIRL